MRDGVLRNGAGCEPAVAVHAKSISSKVEIEISDNGKVETKEGEGSVFIIHLPV